MKRRAAVEPVIGHVKADHRMNRNDLKGQDGDRINAVLAAAGFNFHLLLRRLAALLRAIFPAALSQPDSSPREELHGRLVRTKSAPGSRGEAETKSPVPKLSTWAMILLGFGGLGFAAYRSRCRPISIV